MAQSSQRRAIANYRGRQRERGLCRYEVRGLDSDKALVRQIAARLATNEPDAQRLRAELTQELAGEQPRRGGHLRGVASIADGRSGTRSHARRHRRS